MTTPAVAYFQGATRSFRANAVIMILRIRRPLPATRSWTGITRLPPYQEPLRHPSAPGLSLTGIRLIIPDRALGLPVLRAFSLCTCCRHYSLAAKPLYQPCVAGMQQPTRSNGLEARPSFARITATYSGVGRKYQCFQLVARLRFRPYLLLAMAALNTSLQLISIQRWIDS